MKIFYTIILFIAISINVNAQRRITQTPIAKQRPADFEYLSAPDSLGIRTPRKTPMLNAEKSVMSQQMKLPYPILFIHGLNSNSDTWYDFANFLNLDYGLQFGGYIDYCLNYDGSNYSTNQDFYPTAGADIALYTSFSSLVDADFYAINFDVGIDGSFHPDGSANDVLSNQQAITKQGVAVAYAIQAILQATGRDKVILMGHSMGGLAAREYLQNWTQPDGQHHIGKLATTGTPHGGSDQVTGGWVSGVDCSSEAYRDLRTTYSLSLDNGVYLFGGLENSSVMNLLSCSDFYNFDVNCNGVLGENITGLNYKAIPLDLSYSCAIGTGSGFGGDGCVGATQANINNYISLSFPADTFILVDPPFATELWHTELPKQMVGNMNILDEPNEYVLSYGIDFDTIYSAFTTKQRIGGYDSDYDDFKFTISSTGNVTVHISNITLADLQVRILDLGLNTIGTIVHSSGSSSINFTQFLSAGSYYLEIFGTPTSTSYHYPYNFVLNFNPSTVSINEPPKKAEINIYPNPSTGNLIITQNIVGKSDVEVFNIVGELIYKTELTNLQTSIDLSNVAKGTYFVKLTDTYNNLTNKRIIIQ